MEHNGAAAVNHGTDKTGGSKSLKNGTYLPQFLQSARRHAYALTFCILLAAVSFAALLELPPLFRQSTFAVQTEESTFREALNRPDKIDLNTAVEAELTCLSGIGEVKAQAILSYRAQHGAFASVEELTNVSGISEGILSKIRHLVTVL